MNGGFISPQEGRQFLADDPDSGFAHLQVDAMLDAEALDPATAESAIAALLGGANEMNGQRFHLTKGLFDRKEQKWKDTGWRTLLKEEMLRGLMSLIF